MKYRIQNKIYDTLEEAIEAQNIRIEKENNTIHEYTAPLSAEDEYNNK